MDLPIRLNRDKPSQRTVRANRASGAYGLDNACVERESVELGVAERDQLFSKFLQFEQGAFACAFTGL